MDGETWALALLGLFVWTIFNRWNDGRIRARCGARDGAWGLCREPVARRGDRCSQHVSRRHRSIGP